MEDEAQSDAARVIYLHGFASSPGSAKATRFAKALDDRGVPSRFPDLNQGDFRGLTISRQLCLLDTLCKGAADGSLLIIGSSLGGYAAALWAARSPAVAALVLMAPAFDFAARWRARLGQPTITAWEAAGAVAVMHHGTGKMEMIGWSLMADAERHEPFPEARVPTLILHGCRDETVDFALSTAFARDRPRVELVGLDADHGLLGVLDTVVARAFQFLAPWLPPAVAGLA